jgi:hypothetical protein
MAVGGRETDARGCQTTPSRVSKKAVQLRQAHRSFQGLFGRGRERGLAGRQQEDSPEEQQARRNRGVSAFGLGADPGRPCSTRRQFHVVTGAYRGSTEQQRAHRGKRHRDMRMRSRIKRE